MRKHAIAFVAAVTMSVTPFAWSANPDAQSSGPSQQDVQSAAAKLGAMYDSNYAAKNADAMAQLYAEDGVLVSPGGKIVKGRDALREYYKKRFASGAKQHHIKVLDANVQGAGGFSISDFSVQVPNGNGNFKKESGHILAVLQSGSTGWHFRVVEPSTAAK